MIFLQSLSRCSVLSKLCKTCEYLTFNQPVCLTSTFCVGRQYENYVNATHQVNSSLYNGCSKVTRSYGNSTSKRNVSIHCVSVLSRNRDIKYMTQVRHYCEHVTGSDDHTAENDDDEAEDDVEVSGAL